MLGFGFVFGGALLTHLAAMLKEGNGVFLVFERGFIKKFIQYCVPFVVRGHWRE